MPLNIYDDPRPANTTRYAKRVFGTAPKPENEQAAQGWPLRMPDDDVKAIVMKQRSGMPLTDRERIRLQGRVAAENETTRMGGRVDGAIQPRRLNATELGQQDRVSAAENAREIEDYGAGFEGRPVRRVFDVPSAVAKERAARNTRAGLDSDPRTGLASGRLASAAPQPAGTLPRGYAVRRLGDGTYRTASGVNGNDSVMKDFRSRDEVTAYYRPPTVDLNVVAGGDDRIPARSQAATPTPRRVLEVASTSAQPVVPVRSSVPVSPQFADPEVRPALPADGTAAPRRLDERPRGLPAVAANTRPQFAVPLKQVAPSTPAKPGFFAKRTQEEFERDYPYAAQFNRMLGDGKDSLGPLEGIRLGPILSDIQRADAVTAQHDYRESRQRLQEAENKRQAAIRADFDRQAEVMTKLRGQPTRSPWEKSSLVRRVP